MLPACFPHTPLPYKNIIIIIARDQLTKWNRSTVFICLKRRACFMYTGYFTWKCSAKMSCTWSEVQTEDDGITIIAFALTGTFFASWQWRSRAGTFFIWCRTPNGSAFIFRLKVKYNRCGRLHAWGWRWKGRFCHSQFDGILPSLSKSRTREDVLSWNRKTAES